MFDFAWSELALIAVVALIVIGPKDLPRVMRTVGFWVRKARTVAHEFQGSLEQMVREAELEDVRAQVEKAARFNFDETIAKHIDPQGELKGALDDPVLRNPMAELPQPPAPEALPAPAAPPPESVAPAPPELEAPPVKPNDGGR
jgi:sec-independent protein translocase protein TatB